MDKRIAEATKMGEKNLRTISLIKNWCAHARLESYSGGGLIGVMTGLPIGHQSMACDYAPAGGKMSAWDLEVAALDFHDRYCVDCAHRQPVGLPNLSTLVAERDQAVDAAARREATAALEREEAHRQRQAVRTALRATLPPVAKTLVDQLDKLDSDPSGQSAAELAAAAQLAPEAFTPELIEHLFTLVESGERWGTEAALTALDAVGGAPKRLANGALRSLARYGGVKSAEVLLHNLDYATASLVPAAVPMLIHHARPEDYPIAGPDRADEPKYLIAVHKAFPHEVETVIDTLLETKDRWKLSDGARAICVLGAADGAVAVCFARTVIAKLVRSTWLEEDEFNAESVFGELREAAALAFAADPVSTESLIEKFRIGASDKTQKQLFMIYRWVLRKRPREDRPTPLDAGERAAFDRMLALASNPPNGEVAQELASVFTHSFYGYETLLGDKIDALLGAAVLLADHLTRLDAQHNASPTANFLTGLERGNHRSALTSLQKGLIALGAEAAAGNPGRTRQYLDLLSEIPAEQDELRHRFIKQLHRLVTSPETLAEVLPPLYAALVGSSTFERAAAARTIGKMSSARLADAPPLLMEAFIALLNDPFLMPVAETVEALDRVQVPEHFHAAIKSRLIRIVLSYAATATQQSFLVQTIDTLVSRYLSEENRNGEVGAQLIEILGSLDRYRYSQKLGSFSYRFQGQPAFGTLIAQGLADPNFREHDSELDHLRRLPAATIAANSQAFEDLVPSFSLTGRDWVTSLALIESFTRAGLWDAALRIVAMLTARLPDVPNNRSRRLLLSALEAALAIEQAVAASAFDNITALAAIWREAISRYEDEASRVESR